MHDYFAEPTEDEPTEDEPTEDEPTEDEPKKKRKGNFELDVDVDNVIEECKKAIKKGKVKKANKLVAMLDEDSKAYKKLCKKIEDM